MNPIYFPFFALLALVATQQCARADDALAGYADGAHVVVSGSVVEIDGSDFVLDYGGDPIEVELEDWGWDAAETSRSLQVGDRVMVSGRIDDDWFSDRELEADNVYTLRTYTAYLADADPAYRRPEPNASLQDGTFVSVSGTVTGIDGDTLSVDTGTRTVAVDGQSVREGQSGEAGSDPQQRGARQGAGAGGQRGAAARVDGSIGRSIAVGDRIYAYGQADAAFWNDDVLKAEVLLRIDDVRARQRGGQAAAADGRPGRGAGDR